MGSHRCQIFIVEKNGIVGRDEFSQA